MRRIHRKQDYKKTLIGSVINYLYIVKNNSNVCNLLIPAVSLFIGYPYFANENVYRYIHIV
jgi:hypothetical protein